MSNANEPASPRYYLSQNRDGEYQPNTDGAGLTKREAMAMHERAPDDMSQSLAEALVGRKVPAYDEDQVTKARFWATANAAYRVMQADALLAELARTEG